MHHELFTVSARRGEAESVALCATFTAQHMNWSGEGAIRREGTGGLQLSVWGVQLQE